MTLAQPPAERIAFAYETVTSQLPKEGDVAALAKGLEDLEALYRDKPDLAKSLIEDEPLGAASPAELAAWTMLVNALYNLDITKKRQ